VRDGAYHVYARGNDRAAIFRDDVDRRFYVGLLGRVVTHHRWTCLAYCLMENHVHLMVETPQANLSLGMRALHGGYAQRFNYRHDRSGHVFQGRYGATLIRSDAQLCATAVYIARNPVEAGLCRFPEDWTWSSYRDSVKATGPAWLASDRLLSFIAPEPRSARRSFSQMCV
jgi:REP element-mobilizing transposase RayT